MFQSAIHLAIFFMVAGIYLITNFKNERATTNTIVLLEDWREQPPTSGGKREPTQPNQTPLLRMNVSCTQNKMTHIGTVLCVKVR
jgi:hypothetical protein